MVHLFWSVPRQAASKSLGYPGWSQAPKWQRMSVQADCPELCSHLVSKDKLHCLVIPHFRDTMTGQVAELYMLATMLSIMVSESFA